MAKRKMYFIGGLAAAAGFALLGASFLTGSTSTYAGQETPTGTVTTGTTTPGTTGTAVGTGTAAAGTTTPAATRTAGPLTPVSTPTGGAAPILPSTGTGSDAGGADWMWLAALGVALAVAGGAFVTAGSRRT